MWSWQLSVVALIAGLVNSWSWYGRAQPDDWASLWIAGMLVDRGQSMHIYDRDPQEFTAPAGQAWLDAMAQVPTPFPHPFVHNPFVAFVMAPLTTLSDFATSVDTLNGCVGAATVVFVASIFRLWCSRVMPWGMAAAAAAVVFALPVTHSSVWLGQTTMLIMAGASFALAISSKRPYVAGIVLGLVAAIKITPLVLIPVFLFSKNRWKAGVVAFVATAAPFVIIAVSPARHLLSLWWQALQPLKDGVIVGDANLSVASLITGADPTRDSVAWLVTDVPSNARIVPMMLAIVSVVCAVAAAWVNRRFRFQILAVSAWCIGVGFSTIVWSHYLVLVAITVGGILAMADTPWTKNVAWFGAAAVLVPMVFPLTPPVAAHSFTQGPTYSGMYAFMASMVLMWVIAAIHAVHGAGRSAGESMFVFDEADAYVAGRKNQP